MRRSSPVPAAVAVITPAALPVGMLRTDLDRCGVVDLSISGVTQTLSMTPGAARQDRSPVSAAIAAVAAMMAAAARAAANQRRDETEFHWCISIFLDFLVRFVLGHCWVCVVRASPAAASWGGPRGRADDVPDPEHQQGSGPADQQLARPAPQGTAAVERADCRAHAEQGQAGRHDRDDQSGPAGAER